MLNVPSIETCLTCEELRQCDGEEDQRGHLRATVPRRLFIICPAPGHDPTQRRTEGRSWLRGYHTAGLTGQSGPVETCLVFYHSAIECINTEHKETVGI